MGKPRIYSMRIYVYIQTVASLEEETLSELPSLTFVIHWIFVQCKTLKVTGLSSESINCAECSVSRNKAPDSEALKL